MTSVTLPTIPEQASVSAGLWWLAGAGAATIGWVVFLAVLAWRTANPPLINTVQILESDLVLVGRWKDRRQGSFEVVDELKHGERKGLMTISGAPVDPHRPSSSSELWVVPVRREGTSWKVTQGRFVNRPRGTPEKDSGDPPPWIVQVQPQEYPATKEVLQQIRKVLGRPPPEKAQASSRTPLL